MGLRVGLLIGVLFALFKTVQSRRDRREPAPEPWQPIVDTPRPRPQDVAPEPAPEPEPRRAPTPPLSMPVVPPVSPDPPVPPVDEVGEPIEEPAAPLPEPADHDHPAEQVEAEVAMVAEEILDPAPVAKLEPLDIVPEADKPVAPVKKAAKVAKKAAKKAVTKAAKKAAGTTRKTAKRAAAAATPFVEPVGGICPQTHPVKAKLASRLFHLPGMFAYDRTRPDRCYVDASAAEADGFTRARR